jgi:hypothetical protein
MVRHIPLHRNQKTYDDFFINQAGYGLPVFVGSRSQRGRGLGSFLSGIGRMVLPILKTGGKALLREGTRTGLSVLSDVLEGKNIKDSFKDHATEAGKRLLHGAVQHVSQNMTGSGLAPPGEPFKKRIKRHAKHHRAQSKKRHSKKRKSDIFG